MFRPFLSISVLVLTFSGCGGKGSAVDYRNKLVGLANFHTADSFYDVDGAIQRAQLDRAKAILATSEEVRKHQIATFDFDDVGAFGDDATLLGPVRAMIAQYEVLASRHYPALLTQMAQDDSTQATAQAKTAIREARAALDSADQAFGAALAAFDAKHNIKE